MPTVWAHVETVTVTITDEGFSPRKVTVDTSSTVLFVNKDTAAHWPASDPHPRHDEYPEFDPTKAIEPTEWWLFKPTKAGTWHYHDHLNPHRKGTLVVTAEEDTAADTSSSAPDARPGFFARLKNTLGSWWHALTASVEGTFSSSPKALVLSALAFRELPEKEQYGYVEILAKAKGVAQAWQFAKDAFSTQAGTSLGGRSHDVAHFIGGLIYKEQGLKGLSVCDTTFAFGCYHGFTEGAFAKSLDPLLQVAIACEALGPVSSGPWSSCIHGIGHGVASYYNSTDLEPALATCNTLGPGATFCHDGVFMEFAISAPVSFYDRARPLSPCDTVPLAYQVACGRNILAAMSSRFNLPPLTVAIACLEANAPFTNSCIDTYGFAIAHQEHMSGAQIAAGCAALKQPVAIAQCAGAAAGELVFQNFPDWQTQAPAVCQALRVSDQQTCLTRVNQTISNYKR